jgi:hypothetical protein
VKDQKMGEIKIIEERKNDDSYTFIDDAITLDSVTSLKDDKNNSKDIAKLKDKIKESAASFRLRNDRKVNKLRRTSTKKGSSGHGMQGHSPFMNNVFNCLCMNQWLDHTKMK